MVDAATGERSVLETTQNHPFWDATTGEWVEAGQLTPGHRLLVHDEDRLEGDGRVPAVVVVAHRRRSWSSRR